MSIRTLTPELQLIAKKELREDPSKIQDYLQQIREWVITQNHLNVRPEDQWLLLFLRGCKYDIEKTKGKIETFYTIRTLVPEFFSDRDPLRPEIQELLKLGVCVPLPKSLNGQPVLVVRFTGVDPKRIHTFDIIKVIIMSIDILLNENDNFVIVGHKAIQDLTDVTVRTMLQVTPGYARKVFTCFQNAFPVRHKVAYFLNPPPIFMYLYPILKTFMSKKLKERFKLRSTRDIDELYDDIPRSVLPIEYDGEDGPIEDMAADWKRKVESYREWFLNDEKYRSDESKRPKQSVWSLQKMIFGK